MRYCPRMEPDSSTPPGPGLIEILFLIFLRLVAISCFWFGLQYWAMLTGYSISGQGRFDMLGTPWKVAGAGLAVIFPVAALGLWIPVSWGPVIWFCGAGTQIMMYRVWPEIFGSNTLVPLMHGLVAAVYVLFRVFIWLEKRQKEEAVTGDLPWR